MRNGEKRAQGKGQDRGYFEGYLSLFTTCNLNFIVGYLYSSNHRSLGGEGEIQQCGAGTRGG